MKLKFIKDEDENVKIKLVSDTEKDFKYIDLINFLFEGGELSPPEYDGEFFDDEKELISDMSQKISQQVKDIVESREESNPESSS